ncbi:hypothetical protein BK022_27360 [Methylorubrum extorquens]|uniref:Sulfur globule protein n=1 Tax=Methylorubrum extorquens TaxID=408 RepID=A0A1S1NH46_METEX|nr:hypothetical protein BK022_27360 [Methylorubrum extorquens]
MFGSRKLFPLLVVAALSTFGATAASAHGHGHGHGHFGHGHGHWGHGHGHGHFGPWGHATVYYGGHCHTRRWVDDFGDVVVRRVCH